MKYKMKFVLVKFNLILKKLFNFIKIKHIRAYMAGYVCDQHFTSTFVIVLLFYHQFLNVSHLS